MASLLRQTLSTSRTSLAASHAIRSTITSRSVLASRRTLSTTPLRRADDDALSFPSSSSPSSPSSPSSSNGPTVGSGFFRSPRLDPTAPPPPEAPLSSAWQQPSFNWTGTGSQPPPSGRPSLLANFSPFSPSSSSSSYSASTAIPGTASPSGGPHDPWASVIQGIALVPSRRQTAQPPSERWLRRSWQFLVARSPPATVHSGRETYVLGGDIGRAWTRFSRYATRNQIRYCWMRDARHEVPSDRRYRLRSERHRRRFAMNVRRKVKLVQKIMAKTR